MSLAGRPPKSARLKIAEGNRGKRPIDPASEPAPPTSSVEPLRGLSAAAKKVWAELAPILIGVGVLTEADRLEFGRLCELAAEVALHRKTLQKEGWTVNEYLLDAGGEPHVDLNGKPIVGKVKAHPAAGLLNAAERKLGVLSDRFGINPSGRARLKTAPPVDEGDELDRLFRRRSS